MSEDEERTWIPLKCPKCGQIFASYLHFCPYCGLQNETKEHSQYWKRKLLENKE